MDIIQRFNGRENRHIDDPEKIKYFSSLKEVDEKSTKSKLFNLRKTNKEVNHKTLLFALGSKAKESRADSDEDLRERGFIAVYRVVDIFICDVDEDGNVVE